MRELATVAALKAEVLAVFYDITGVVAQDVPEELRSNAYDIQRGRLSAVGAVDRLCDILRRRVYVRRSLTLSEARTKAAQMLELCRQLIDLRLPVSPDPTPGHRSTQANPAPIERTEKSAHIGRAGWAGGELFGSDDAPHDTHDVPHELHHEWPRNAA